MTPYVGPETMREFFSFYTYGPTIPAVLHWGWWVRFRLWLATVACVPFTHIGPQPEGPESWAPKWRGDCVTSAFLLRSVCTLLGLPSGALRLAYCEVGGKGHMVLTAETDAGCLAADCVKEAWAPWQGYGYTNWNRETVG